MDLLSAGVTLVLVGLAFMVVAFVLSSRRGEARKTEIRGGGVVMVGPIPIIFGSDTKWVIVAVLLAILLMVLGLLFYVR